MHEEANKPKSPSWETLIFPILLAHIPLSLLIKKSEFMATAFAVLLLIYGLWCIVAKSDDFHLICLVVYMSSAEVIWRMGNATVFWEYGKYAIGFLLAIALLKNNRLRSGNKTALLYFFLLLPSITVMPYFDRELISFNLSGPFLLSIATVFFSTVVINRNQLIWVLIFMLAPLIGAGFLSALGVSDLGGLHITASSRLTSAGYGPNQMSSMLGLGAISSFVLSLITKEKTMISTSMMAISVWMISQSVLTFSRGGFWSAIGSICIFIFYFMRDQRNRKYLITGIALSAVLIGFIAIPKLDRITHGTVFARMQDTGLTGRDRIIKSEWVIFKQYPILGVGPGMAYNLRSLFFKASSAHTEYTRLLAEHGSLGIIAMLCMFFIVLRSYLNSDPHNRSIALAFSFWAMMFMLHAAMRLAACSFLFGLGSALFVDDDKNCQQDPQKPLPYTQS